MKNIQKVFLLLSILGALILPLRASAEDNSSKLLADQKLSLDDNFRVGFREATVGTGVLLSPIWGGTNRPTVDYVVGLAQAGYMLTEPGKDGFFRGSLEFLAEAFAAGIYGNTGNYIAGGTLWLRHNFVQPGWKFVPYVQGGAGLTAMNIDHRYDGKDFNFNLELSAGCRYFIKPKTSLNLEYRFQHISNADLWAHNIGINAQGPVLGISWFF